MFSVTHLFIISPLITINFENQTTPKKSKNKKNKKVIEIERKRSAFIIFS